MFAAVLLSLLWATVQSAQSIGSVRNATYTSSSYSATLVFNSSCSECVCYAFMSPNASNYRSFNCYSSARLCVFFSTDFSSISSSMLQVNRSATFFFKTPMPPPATTTTPSPLTLNWNTTAIVVASAGSSLSQVNHSYGIFIPANSDMLYIADSDNNRITVWLPNATSGILLAGGQGRGANATQLNDPREVYIDLYGNVYVADSGNYRVRRFPNGSTIGSSIAGNGSITASTFPLGNLLGLGVDIAGNVYVSDYDFARVTKWSPNSTFGIMVAGDGTQGNSPGQLNFPTAFYTDPATGTLYICSQGGHCMMKWLPNGVAGVVIAGVCGLPGTNQTLLTVPKGVTLDKYGNMYIVDGVGGGRIIMFPPGSLVGRPIVTTGLLNPISIAVDTQLTLFVSDWSNNRIVKYRLLN